jgi:anti-anti-sigma factor
VAVGERSVGNRLILSPQESLVAGGGAEEFEHRTQALLRKGYRRLVADMRNVPEVDSAGLRALVRAHTTAKRLGGSFRLVRPTERCLALLRLAKLDDVLEIHDSVEEMPAIEVPWSAIRLAGAALLLSALLVAVGLQVRQGSTSASDSPLGSIVGAGAPSTAFHPLIALLSLVASALIGWVVTAVHKHCRQDKPLSQSMEQAQVLLCVSGAMMMIVIGNSLVRAFGVAGAASIIRFRTPVDDPRDITILFLLMGLGMSTGIGAFATAGLGTLFICAMLVLLDRFSERRRRTIDVVISADAREFPSAHVESVFAANGVEFEPREVSQGKEAVARYRTTLEPDVSIEELSDLLLARGAAGIKGVSWESKKP